MRGGLGRGVGLLRCGVLGSQSGLQITLGGSGGLTRRLQFSAQAGQRFVGLLLGRGGLLGGLTCGLGLCFLGAHGRAVGALQRRQRGEQFHAAAGFGRQQRLVVAQVALQRLTLVAQCGQFGVQCGDGIRLLAGRGGGALGLVGSCLRGGLGRGVGLLLCRRGLFCRLACSLGLRFLGAHGRAVGVL